MTTCSKAAAGSSSCRCKGSWCSAEPIVNTPCSDTWCSRIERLQFERCCEVLEAGSIGYLQDECCARVTVGERRCGIVYLTNTKRPVTRLEDLDGVKLRVMQNNVFLDSFKTLGANAVPLPFFLAGLLCLAWSDFFLMPSEASSLELRP